MGKTATDLTGQSFHLWSVIALSHTKGPHKYYRCRCQCGTEKVVQANSLVAGTSQSCGCHRRKASAERATSHGMTGHRAYSIWQGMTRRCSDPNFAAYRWYGARGIKVCERWADFALFWEDMGPAWKDGLSLDRINSDGDYAPQNCRWVAVKEQGLNKRNNKMIDTPWGPLPQSEAARRAGISVGALVNRIKAGWPKPRWFDPSTR